MLGRKTYTREELDRCRTVIDAQLVAYQALLDAVPDDDLNGALGSAREAFEVPFFNNLILALDRHFVHRVRVVSGKDGNPLNEVEMLADCLMTNDGVLQPSTVIKLKPDESILKIPFGDPIRLTADQFALLSSAFLAEIDARFLE